MKHGNSVIKRAGILLLALALVLALAGCAGGSGSSSVSSNSSESSQTSSEAESGQSAEGSSQDDENTTFTARLSFANFEYIESGDDSYDKLIRNVDTQVTAAGSSEKDRIEAAVNALRTVPSDRKGAETMVNDLFDINFIKVSGSSAVIDLSGKTVQNAGDTDIVMFIYQVTDTILNTFPDIDGVRFTVDGTNTDELGSEDISAPFTKSMVNEFLAKSETDSSDLSSEAESAENASSGDAAANGTSDDNTGSENSKTDNGTTDDSSTQNGVQNDEN